MKYALIVPCGVLVIYHHCITGYCPGQVLIEMNGHRCGTTNETVISNTFVDLHICKAECMQRPNCLFLNFNSAEGRCIIGKRDCAPVELSADHYMAFFGRKTDLCIKWTPLRDKLRGKLVCGSHWCRSHVGRVLLDSHLIPGELVDDKVYYALNSSKSGSMDALEVLDAMHGCEVAWMPFSAGDSILNQAVVGGYLSRGSSGDVIPVYIIKGSYPPGYMLGYYDPVSKMGFGGRYEIRIYTHMEMLLLL